LAVPLLLALLAAAGLLFSFAAEASAASFGKPAISTTQATFTIPPGTAASWTLKLWSGGTLEGMATGTSGTLTVAVPNLPASPCTVQADIRAVTPSGAPFYFAGNRRTLPRCGVTPPTQNISGHIYLCTAGAPTTTEVSGGTLAATGPETLMSHSNPVTPTAVTAGGYTMTASAPPTFTFVLCGGTATVGSGGQTASQSVTVPSGGAGAGLFYVTGPPTAGNGGSGGSAGATGNGPPTAAGSGSTGNPAAATTAAVTSPTPAASSQLAFTGMDAGPPLLLGVALVLLGSLLIRFSRARRLPEPTAVRVRPPS
jgi:hypothetical protein